MLLARARCLQHGRLAGIAFILLLTLHSDRSQLAQEYTARFSATSCQTPNEHLPQSNRLPHPSHLLKSFRTSRVIPASSSSPPKPRRKVTLAGREAPLPAKPDRLCVYLTYPRDLSIKPALSYLTKNAAIIMNALYIMMPPTAKLFVDFDLVTCCMFDDTTRPISVWWMTSDDVLSIPMYLTILMPWRALRRLSAGSMYTAIALRKGRFKKNYGST
ncbi:hypothetical protein DFH29DRAFT_879674 [Suillus ampliporus]|nr:hypothetical protein DFH29DRAFT_879674 [Suillus ampliporus]